MKSVTVSEIQVPSQLHEYMRQFVDLFPHGVTYEKETRSAIPIKPFSFEMRVTHAYVAFVTEFEDVTDSLDLVLHDFRNLTDYPPINPKEGERRYFLLTRVFFYELLRIKDSFPRFLKRMEDNGLLTREQRISSKKMIEDWMKEHYLIRNTYLHGHTMPKNESEFDLSLMVAAHDLGYAPELVPLDGSEKKVYPELLAKLATKRHDFFSIWVMSMSSSFKPFWILPPSGLSLTSFQLTRCITNNSVRDSVKPRLFARHLGLRTRNVGLFARSVMLCCSHAEPLSAKTKAFSLTRRAPSTAREAFYSTCQAPCASFVGRLMALRPCQKITGSQ